MSRIVKKISKRIDKKKAAIKIVFVVWFIERKKKNRKPQPGHKQFARHEESETVVRIAKESTRWWCPKGGLCTRARARDTTVRFYKASGCNWVLSRSPGNFQGSASHVGLD